MTIFVYMYKNYTVTYIFEIYLINSYLRKKKVKNENKIKLWNSWPNSWPILDLKKIKI